MLVWQQEASGHMGVEAAWYGWGCQVVCGVQGSI
jgi:hypothetical protein